ncbi:vWA domain-containing protein [Longispora urticae]
MTDPSPTIHSDCLPTYIVLDTSGSMGKHEQLLNDTLEYVIESVANSPRVAEFAHISIISFNDDAHVVVSMTDVQKLAMIPEVKCDGLTEYGKAFRLIKNQINIDVPALRAQGRGVLRPTVFMLTDGGPSDKNWEQDFADLTDRQWPRHPHVVTFGFGTAPAAIIGRIATKKAFIAQDVLGGSTAITTFLGELLNTLVKSSERGQVELPAEVANFKTIVLPHEHVD